MACGNGGSRKLLCPVSFGVALGVTAALTVLAFTAWIMMYGVPPMMEGHMLMTPTWQGGFMHAFWALLKGFAFGFVFALIYDMISCMCKGKCCKKSANGCNCGCTTCGCKPEAGK